VSDSDSYPSIRVLNSLEAVAAASADPSCAVLVRRIGEEVIDDVRSLKGFCHHAASGHEREATRGMASDKALEGKFGKLELLNDGRGVVFRHKCPGHKSHGLDFVQCDGLAHSSSHLLLNEVKSHFMEEDVGKLIGITAHRVRNVLSSPALYSSDPEAILEKLAGLSLSLVPIASSANFDADAEQACVAAGIPMLRKDGSGFECTLPITPLELPAPAPLQVAGPASATVAVPSS